MTKRDSQWDSWQSAEREPGPRNARPALTSVASHYQRQAIPVVRDEQSKTDEALDVLRESGLL